MQVGANLIIGSQVGFYTGLAGGVVESSISDQAGTNYSGTNYQ